MITVAKLNCSILQHKVKILLQPHFLDMASFIWMHSGFNHVN